MSVAKIAEVSSGSSESVEDAIREGIARAAKTLKNIQSVWINEQEVSVIDGAISEWRVIMKITFVVDE